MALDNDIRSELLAAYERSGEQQATIYLPTPSSIEDAEKRLEIRTKNVLKALDEAEASEAIVGYATEALDQLDHADGPAQIMVISDSGVDLRLEMERPLAHMFVTLGVTPALLPIVEATQTDVPHLAVLVDRTGADVLRRNGVGDAIDEFKVDGPDVRVHRSHPGGWSQKRFQQTAENAWENNAREVVDEITNEHRDIDLIVCGGDVRAVGFFIDHLPERCEVHQVDGSRHSDQDAFLDEADTVLRSLAAEQLVDLADQWRDAAANDLGSKGLEVLDHLTQGRVDHLLVVNDTLDSQRRMSRFDFSVPAHLPDDDSGTETGTETAISDGAIALAAATGAKITVVPALHDIELGLAAILRF